MARPNGYFDLSSDRNDGSDTVDFGDDSPFGDLIQDEPGQGAGPLFSVAPATEILGSRFNASQSDELVAINASNPQIGITDFAEMMNERLDVLLGHVRGSEDRITALLDEVVANPDQVVNEDLLHAIEEFIEVSKYALVTYEALQKKVDRLLPNSLLTDNKELDNVRNDISRLLHDRIEQRAARHKALVELIGEAAQRDEQLTALVARVYSDLGVQGDHDFDEAWLHGGRKTFVTLPDAQIEFLKRFDKILEKLIEESNKTSSFFKSNRGEDQRDSELEGVSSRERVTLSQRFRGLKDRAVGRFGKTYNSVSDRISSRFGSMKFSLKKTGAVLVAIGVTAGGIALTARQLGSESNETLTEDKIEQTDDTVVLDSTPTQEGAQESEPLNPHTNKPFTETEIEFLTWVNEQMAQGFNETQIAEMMANLVASQNADQVPVDIGTPASETNSNIQSRRTGGDSSRRAQVRARSQAAQRNQQARQNVPVVTSPSSIPAPTEQAPSTTTVVPAPEETGPTTTIDVPDNTSTSTTTSTTLPSNTTTTLDPIQQTQQSQLLQSRSVVSSPRGLESLSIDLR